MSTDKRNVSYLTDHTGKPSMTRFLSVISLVVAVALTALVGLITYQGQDPSTLDYLFNLILVWIVGAFAPKVVAAYIEQAFMQDDEGGLLSPRVEKDPQQKEDS